MDTHVHVKNDVLEKEKRNRVDLNPAFIRKETEHSHHAQHTHIHK